MNKAAVLFLVTLSLGFTACSKDNDKPDSLNQAMEKAGNPNYEILTRLLIQKHMTGFALTEASANLPKWQFADYEKSLADLAPAGLATRSPWESKVEIESRLKALNGGVDLPYNKDHVTIGSPLRMGRLQCYSGATLHLLVMRQMNAQDFQKLNMVMIFTPGHVLPGYMIPEGDSFRLVGAEITVAGQGRADFGLAKDLSGAIRVVDAEAFVQVEALSHLLTNEAEVRGWALRKTADLYGISLEKTEESVKPFGGATDTSAGMQVNVSTFGFSSPSDSTPGDRVRNIADTVPMTSPAFYGAGYVLNATIPKPEYTEIAGIPMETTEHGYDIGFGKGSPLMATQFGRKELRTLDRAYTNSFNNKCHADLKVKRDLTVVYSQVAQVLKALEESSMDSGSAGQMSTAVINAGKEIVALNPHLYSDKSWPTASCFFDPDSGLMNCWLKLETSVAGTALTSLELIFKGPRLQLMKAWGTTGINKEGKTQKQFTINLEYANPDRKFGGLLEQTSNPQHRLSVYHFENADSSKDRVYQDLSTGTIMGGGKKLVHEEEATFCR